MTIEQGAVTIIGAGGRQGGAVLDHLRARGTTVRALFDEGDAERRRESGLVRDAGGSDDARGPAPEIRFAKFDDAESLGRELQDAEGLFFVLDDPETGPAERLRRGRAIATAAAVAGVGRVVFSAATGPDHHRLACDVGDGVARQLEALGVPATVLRPATIMEEIPWYWLHRYGPRIVLATPFVPTNHLALVALEDVGGLAALALTHPGRFAGRTLDVAGDVLTPLDIAVRLAESLGEPVRYEEVQVEGVFVYQEASTRRPDMARLHEAYPELHTFDGWLEDAGGLELCRHAIERSAA